MTKRVLKVVREVAARGGMANPAFLPSVSERVWAAAVTAGLLTRDDVGFRVVRLTEAGRALVAR